MKFALVTFRLRDGCTAVLRTPDPARDAADMVQYLRDAAAETPFVLRLPEEIAYTVEGEERFLRGVADSPNDCFIVCEVEGRIAGNSHLSFSTLAKTRHSCTVAIALRKAYWGNGIGTAMFEVMERAAREREGGARSTWRSSTATCGRAPCMRRWASALWEAVRTRSARGTEACTRCASCRRSCEAHKR